MQRPAIAKAREASGTSRSPRLIEGMLSNMELFRALAQRPLAEIAARSKVLQFRRGATICAASECTAVLHAIAYGKVKLALRGGDGEERVLRIAGPAQTFGLAVAILGRALPYEAVALEDSLLIRIPAGVVLALVESDPRFTRAVIASLAERKLSLLAEVGAGSLLRGVQRLAAYLESLAVPNGSDGSFLVHLPTTKTVVAARLGVKKETLSRMLRELAQKRLIAVQQREIAILDRPGLASIASQGA